MEENSQFIDAIEIDGVDEFDYKEVGAQNLLDDLIDIHDREGLNFANQLAITLGWRSHGDIIDSLSTNRSAVLAMTTKSHMQVLEAVHYKKTPNKPNALEPAGTWQEEFLQLYPRLKPKVLAACIKTRLGLGQKAASIQLMLNKIERHTTLYAYYDKLWRIHERLKTDPLFCDGHAYVDALDLQSLLNGNMHLLGKKRATVRRAANRSTPGGQRYNTAIPTEIWQQIKDIPGVSELPYKPLS